MSGLVPWKARSTTEVDLPFNVKDKAALTLRRKKGNLKSYFYMQT